jgi:hypothetical protein
LLNPQFDRFKRLATADREAIEKELVRRKELRAEKQRRDKAKKATEQEKLKAKKIREDRERKKQEQLWTSLNATTGAAKQRTCLHSEFWPREQQQRKFKVGVLLAHTCTRLSVSIAQLFE